jgi:hypothetical protein
MHPEEQDMTLYVIDTFFDSMVEADHVKNKDHIKRYLNPTFIPRVGEQISWSYAPHPTVKSVIHDLDRDHVWVVLE